MYYTGKPTHASDARHPQREHTAVFQKIFYQLIEQLSKVITD
jgi:hypothetical protein